MSIRESIVKEVLARRPAQKAELVDKLLSCLDTPDGEIDTVWAKEAEDRIDAYDRREIKAVTLQEVLEKYT
jgi:hypothetical protein